MYKEINIAFNKKNYFEIYNTLYLCGINKILEEDGLIKIYYKGNESNKIADIGKILIKSAHVKPADIRITTLPSEDWFTEWKKTIEPVNIKDKIIIYPSWKKRKVFLNKKIHLVEIDPKMSFGTGHNDTTQLILEMMVDYVKRSDKYLLDYGCGTGILAIAGIKLGIQKAIAIDIDEDAIRDADECMRNNSVKSNIKLYKKDIGEIQETKFDVIVCNIISSVILSNLGTISIKLKNNGKLFLTGILESEKNELAKAIRKNGLSVLEIRKKGEWLAFYCMKSKNK
jgi:ribosomal protein L11 methyltransferase